MVLTDKAKLVLAEIAATKLPSSGIVNVLANPDNPLWERQIHALAQIQPELAKRFAEAMQESTLAE